MSSRSIQTAGIVIFAILVSGLTLFIAPRNVRTAELPCPVGTTHRATAADVAKMKIANGTDIAIGTCITPEVQTMLGVDSINDSVSYLQGKLCAGKVAGYDAAKPAARLKEENVYFSAPGAGGMDPKFLACFKRYMEAAPSRGLDLCISAAFRTPEHQTSSASDPRNSVVCGRTSSVLNCPHVRGIAIDINEARGKYNEAHQLAQSIGLKVPLPVADKFHIESGGGNCGTPSFTVGATPIGFAAPPSPADAIRNFFGGNQNQLNTSQCITSMNPLNIAPPGTVPQSQCLTNAQGQQPQLPPQPALPAQPASPGQPSSPATSPATQPTASAQPNASSQMNPMQPLVTYPPFQMKPVSDLINANAKKATSTATSTFDLILQYLDPISGSIDIGKAIDISLNPDVRDATALDPTKPTSALSATGTLAAYQTLNVPQTFTSNDLSQNPVPSSYVAGQNTFLLNVLDTMKNVLLYALNYLKPFGGRVPNQFSGE